MPATTSTTRQHIDVNLPRRRLGKYELIGKLAEGGMGSIYAAKTRGLGGFERTFAVKVCHPHLTSTPEFVAMFLDEARLAAGIHHPNVVSTIDVDRIDDVLFLVMEYIEGQSLKWLLSRSKKHEEKAPLSILLRIVHDVLLGLHAAHELLDHDGRSLNLVHRDVSPQNVLVGEDGVSRILDFGVAKAEERYSSTLKGNIKGKLGYMSPEQVSGEEVDRRSDVFAMGVVLWESLTRRLLFKGATPSETAGRVMYATVVRPSEVCVDVPSDLEDVIMRALERDNDTRYSTAGAMAEAIEQCDLSLGSRAEVSKWVKGLAADAIAKRQSLLRTWAQRATEVDVEVVRESSPPPTRWASRRVALLGLLLGLLVVAVVVMGFMLSRGNGDEGRDHRSAMVPAGSEASLSSSDAAADGTLEPRDGSARQVEGALAPVDGGDGPSSRAAKSQRDRRSRRPSRPPRKSSSHYDPESI